MALRKDRNPGLIQQRGKMRTAVGTPENLHGKPTPDENLAGKPGSGVPADEGDAIAARIGPAGQDGDEGPAGGLGPPGPQGLKGDPGAAGISNVPGVAGADGEEGPDGAPGPPGPAGTPGAAGTPGLPGVPGEDGLPGADGAPGGTGPVGATGSTGLAGVPGAHGDDGVDGLDGVPGVTGVAGAAGATGATGPQGPVGVHGVDGEDGQESIMPGPMGLQGLTGAQGIPGRPGDDGEDGAILNLFENPVLVAHGGTGAQSFTLNGVLYGNGTGAVLATAQGPATSVLTANGGAPVFSATPEVEKVRMGFWDLARNAGDGSFAIYDWIDNKTPVRVSAGSPDNSVWIDTTGVGFQQTAPTAYVHLGAGTATAGTAPLKMTSGPLLTAVEAGAVEFLTDAYYVSTTALGRRMIALALPAVLAASTVILAGYSAIVPRSHTINSGVALKLQSGAILRIL